MAEQEQGDHSVLQQFFAHNTWANLKLLDFCAGLSDEQLDSTLAVGGFGTIRATLLHTIGAEVSYVRRGNGKQPPRPFARGDFPGFDVLQEAARWTGDELLQLAISARAETIVRETFEQESAEYPLASLMVQAITHSTEHRAQVAAVITLLGMEPPDMSGWCFMEERGEFQEVGTEA